MSHQTWLDNPDLLLRWSGSWTSLTTTVQLYLLGGVLWSLAIRSVLPLAIMLLAALLATLLAERPHLRKIIPSDDDNEQSMNRYRADHTNRITNPLPWAGPPPQCAPSAPVHLPSQLYRMYQPVDMMPDGFYRNPIPDPTLMARHPYFWQSMEAEFPDLARQPGGHLWR